MLCLTTYKLKMAQGLETPAYIIGALTASGGTFGYIRTGSVPSIAAGVTVGALVRFSISSHCSKMLTAYPSISLEAIACKTSSHLVSSLLFSLPSSLPDLPFLELSVARSHSLLVSARWLYMVSSPMPMPTEVAYRCKD